MPWTVEVTDAFERWWGLLSEDERISVDGMIRVLESHGPALGPFIAETVGSQWPRMQQVRVPHKDKDLCVLYVAETSRTAVVLLTGAVALTDERSCPPDAVALADLTYERYRRQHEGD